MQAVVGALRAVLGLDSIAFEKGAKDAQRTLKGLEKSFDQMGVGVQSMARSLNATLSTIGVGVSLGGLVLLQKGLQDWAAQLKDQAERLGISTAALQAYEFAAVKAGVSQEEMNKSFEFFNRKLGDAKAGVPGAVDDFVKLNVRLRDAKGQLIPFGDALQLVAGKIAGMGTAQEKAAAAQNFFSKSGKDTLLMLEALARSQAALTAEAQKGGGLISDKTIKHLDDTKKKLAELSLQYRVAVAEFAANVEIGALEAISRFLESFRREKAAQEQRDKEAGLKKAQEAAAAMAADADAKRLDTIDKVARLEDMIAHNRERLERASATQRIQLLREVVELESIIAQLQGTVHGRGVTGEGGAKKGEPPLPAGDASPGGKRVKIGGVDNFPKVGGGGQSPEERARATLKLWAEEMKLYQETLTELSHNFTIPLDEVERKLESQRRLTKDIAAASKGISDPKLIGQITAEAKAREGLRLAYEETKKAAKDAETAEKAFGDGAVELAARQRELTAAYGSGRLSLEAMTIAMAEATRNAELQRLKMIGLTDQGWGGFIAGFKTAQIEWERANSAFAAGQKAFESVMSHMEDALTKFVTTGKLSFRELANSIISDLIRMQIKAATTSLFGGGGLGSIFGSLFGGSSGTRLGVSAGGLAGGAFAAGGMPPIGQPSWVGEKGPELFVPRAAGTIIPNDALGGGGTTVVQNFNVSGGDEAGVYRALNRVMPQMKKEVLDAVQDARSRGGKFSQTFRQ